MNEYAIYSRDHSIYKTIESCEDHELTYCLAYEMAIRNKQIIKCINNLDPDLFELTINSHLLRNMPIMKIMEDFMFILTKDDLIESKLNLTTDTEALKIINSHKFRTMQQYQETYNIKKSNKLFSNVSSNPFVTIPGSLKVIPESYFPRISQRQPYIPLHKSKKRNITIDFALPMKEIEKYIEAVKQNYDLDRSILNLPLDEYKVKNHKPLYFTGGGKFKNNKPFPVNIMYPIKTKQYRYADMFFIYDKLFNIKNQQNEKAKTDIQNELLDYYTKMVLNYNDLKTIGEQLLRKDRRLEEKKVQLIIETHVYSSLTKVDIKTGIDKYYKILTPYIENMDYKKLLI